MVIDVLSSLTTSSRSGSSVSLFASRSLHPSPTDLSLRSFLPAFGIQHRQAGGDPEALSKHLRAASVRPFLETLTRPSINSEAVGPAQGQLLSVRPKRHLHSRTESYRSSRRCSRQDSSRSLSEASVVGSTTCSTIRGSPARTRTS